ncbi:MAG: hypothetical protein KBD23_05535 [Gammaproteobacteria bacterium]|nr:hypothetical protein [Gammaproteobacteria bacterium]
MTQPLFVNKIFSRGLDDLESPSIIEEYNLGNWLNLCGYCQKFAFIRASYDPSGSTHQNRTAQDEASSLEGVLKHGI